MKQKNIIVLILTLALLLTGCGFSGSYESSDIGIGTGSYEFRELSSSQPTTKEEKYEALKDAYHNGEYYTCFQYCEELGDYENAQKYANLIKARTLYGLSTQKEVTQITKKIMNHINWEDTKEVLVSNYYVAYGYLLGYWTTDNGMHTFEITKKGGYITTIPVIPGKGDTFDIENGYLYTYWSKDPDNRTKEFKITPVSKTKVKIYSYKTQKTYTLTKRR